LVGHNEFQSTTVAPPDPEVPLIIDPWGLPQRYDRSEHQLRANKGETIYERTQGREASGIQLEVPRTYPLTVSFTNLRRVKVGQDV